MVEAQQDDAFVSRNGEILWQEFTRNPQGRLSAQNVFKGKPGPSFLGKKSIVEAECSSAFFLLLDNFIVKRIILCTEAESHRQTQSNEWKLTVDELLAFIGLLYVRGAMCASSLELESMWSSKFGLPIFKETLSRNRFREIMRYLRFDEKSTRSERFVTNKFCMISEIWERFISNGQHHYSPSVELTVDEQLLASKARCPYTQYMPQKPDKFGLKFWLLADKKTKFVLNAFPYLGADDHRPPNTDLASYVVMRLMAPYYKVGHNVTCDNFFTSVHLAENLKKEKTSIVGTIRKNRRDLPVNSAQIEKAMVRYESKFLVCNERDMSLTIYKCKPNKAVFILSSVHLTCTFDSPPKRLPETIDYYNKTKYGVDVFDQMARKYTTKAGSRRWPVHVFYNLLDICGINAWIIYKECTGSRMSRRNFLLKLGEELCTMYTRARHLSSPVSTSDSTIRKKCQVGKHYNMTQNRCSVCNKLCCGQCIGVTVITCKDCSM